MHAVVCGYELTMLMTPTAFQTYKWIVVTFNRTTFLAQDSDFSGK